MIELSVKFKILMLDHYNDEISLEYSQIIPIIIILKKEFIVKK